MFGIGAVVLASSSHLLSKPKIGLTEERYHIMVDFSRMICDDIEQVHLMRYGLIFNKLEYSCGRVPETTEPCQQQG